MDKDIERAMRCREEISKELSTSFINLFLLR